MKKIYIFLLVVILATILVVSAFSFLCKIGVKCENCNQTSSNIDESKINGFYYKKYAFDKSLVNFKYSKNNFQITNVWCEKVWHYNTDNCFNSKYNSPVDSKNGYNIIVEFKTSTDEFLFSLTPLINDSLINNQGGIERARKTMRFNYLPKQFKLIVDEKNPDLNIGWTQKITSDTLTFKLQN